MAQQRLFVTREELDQALRELILSHPDLVRDRSEKAKARHQTAFDRFKHLWQKWENSARIPESPRRRWCSTGAFKA